MDEQEQNFKKLKDFFKKDMNMKNLLMSLAPKEIDDYDEESRMKYMDALYNGLTHFEEEFRSIAESFGLGEEVLNAISKYFEKSRNAFLMSHYDKGMINLAYQQIFSNMDESLIEEIKDQFVGYTDYGNLLEIIGQTKSINELLHAFHSYITNNEAIMQAMPLIATKMNEFGYPISIYGEQTELARKIFLDFPVDMDVGWTDIVSMEKRMLMMVRDRGHALTIEIDKEEAGAVFKYFIPKLCNSDMIEKLPGINKITENGATGIFEASEEEISEKLFGFIGKVPMDSDIVFDWEKITSQITMQNEEKTKQEEKQAIFEENQAKEISIERKTSGIKKIQEMLQKAKNFIKSRFTNEKGDYDNEQSIGDK